MWDGLNLPSIAKELLQINEDYKFRLKDPINNSKDMELKMFPQIWESTYLGFNGIGGSAMTTAMTYVLLPTITNEEDCIVYFAGRFAYKAPLGKSFVEDVRRESVEDCAGRVKYLKEENR